MYDIFDDNAFESENDENLNRKFDYNYQAIKHFYPQVCKLPEKEVAGIVDTMYAQDDDSFDDTKKRTMTYIKGREPFWHKYLHNAPKSKSAFAEAQRQNELRKQQYYDKGFYLTDDQWKDVAKTTLEGLYSAMETKINNKTKGLYNYLDEMSDRSSRQRYDKLLQEAEQAGLGELYSTTQLLSGCF